MFFAKMLISFLVSNWIFAEICFFFPSFDANMRRLYQIVQIPTHDKWAPIMQSSSGRELGHQIGNRVESSGLGRAWPFSLIQDEKLAGLWQKGSLRNIGNLFGYGSDNSSGSQLLSADQFFKRESWHPAMSSRQARKPINAKYAHNSVKEDPAFVEVESIEKLSGALKSNRVI